MRVAQLSVALALAVAFPAFAAEPHIGQMALFAKGSENPQSVFGNDTQGIVLRAEILDVPAGTKAAAAWMAVKTAVASPNYVIDSAGVQLDRANERWSTTFSLSRPSAGWPTGDYKVELTLNGQLAASVPFQVK